MLCIVSTAQHLLSSSELFVVMTIRYFFFSSFPFRAVITEDFKVPDKMVGFSKYLACFWYGSSVQECCMFCWDKTCSQVFVLSSLG